MTALRRTVKVLALGAGAAAASYAVYAGATWLRYGYPKPPSGDDADPLLDAFMPHYEVVDRHKARLMAPADIAFSTAIALDLQSSAVVRAIFKGREWILSSTPQDRASTGLVEELKSLGWGWLAEQPGREIVMGGYTKPWEANPVFHALPPEEFASFADPDFVKIAWTLRVDPLGNNQSMFRTETRAVATDPEARKKFRRYWAFLSPGIIIIRIALLSALRAEVERVRRDNVFLHQRL